MKEETKASVQYKIQKIKCYFRFHADGKRDGGNYLYNFLRCPYCNELYLKYT